MEKELNNILQKYNWSYYKKSESEYDIYNKKNLKVAIIKFSANKYIIYDSDGKNKLMSGKGQVADSVEKLLTKYFYATPITLQQYFTVTEKEFTDAKQKNKKLIEEYAKLNIPEKNDSEIKKIILQDKLVKATKLFAEVGDVVYSLKKDIIYGIESDFKEYKIRTLNKNENTLMGGSDVIIETGYIAGGYDGRAILKKAYDVYLKEIENLDEIKPQMESNVKPETMKKTTKYYKLRVFSIQDFAEFLKELKEYADDIKVFSAGIGEEYLIVTGDYDEQAAMHPMTSVTDFDDIISRSKKIQTYKRLDSKPTPEQRWQGKWVSADERIKHIEQVLKDDNDEEQQQVIEKTDKTEFLKKKISAYKKLLPIVSTEKKAFLQKKIKAFELLVSLNEKKIAEDDIESQILHYKNILRNIDKYPNYNKKNVEIIISELENKKKASSEPVFNRLPEDKQKELKGEWDKMKDFIETTGHQIAIGQLRDLTPEQQSGLVLDTLMKGETINADGTDYLITQKNDKKIVIKNLKTQKTGTIYVMGNEYVSWMKTRKDGTATGFSRAIETDITRSLLDENNPMGALQTDSYLRAKTRLEEIRAEQYNKNKYSDGGFIHKKIATEDIIEGAKFKLSNGIIFIIDRVYRDNDFGIAVETSMQGGKKGNYKNSIKEVINYFNEEKATKLYPENEEDDENEFHPYDVGGSVSPYTLSKSQHTKTGKDIWIIKLSDRVDRNTYNAIASKIKQNGGYWSSFVHGFVFNVEPNPDILDHIFGVAVDVAQKTESVPYNKRGLIVFNEANPNETVNRGVLRQEWEAGKMLAGAYKGFDGMTDSSYYIQDEDIKWYAKGENKYMDDSIASDLRSTNDKAHIDYRKKTITMGWNELKYKPDIQITDIKKPTGLFSYNYYVNLDKEPAETEYKSKSTNHDTDFDLPIGTRVKANFHGKPYCGKIVSNRIHEYDTTSWMMFSGNEKKVEHHKYIYFDILFDNGIKKEMQTFEVVNENECNFIEQPLIKIDNKLEYADWLWYKIKDTIKSIAYSKKSLASRKLEKYRISDKKQIELLEKKLYDYMGLFLAWEMIAAPFVEGVTGENESEQQQRHNLWKEKLNIVPADDVSYSAKEIVESEEQKAKIENKFYEDITPLVEKYKMEKSAYGEGKYYFHVEPEQRFEVKIEIEDSDIKTTLIVVKSAVIEEKKFKNIDELEKYLIELRETYKDFWDNDPKNVMNKVQLPFAITRGSQLIGVYELKQNNILAIDKILHEAGLKTTIVLLADSTKSEKDITFIEVYKSESSYNSWQGSDFIRTVKFYDHEGNLISKTTFSTYEGTFGSGLQNFFWSRAWKYWAKDKLPSKGLKMAKKDNLENVQEFKGYIVGETVKTNVNDNIYIIKSFKDIDKALQEKVLLHPVKLVIDGKDTFIDESDTTFDSEFNYADLEKISEPDAEKESEVKVVSEKITTPTQSEQEIIELAEEMGHDAAKNGVPRVPSQCKRFKEFFIDNEAAQADIKNYTDAWYKGWDDQNNIVNKRLKNVRSEFLDNLHPLDLWQEFNDGDGLRFYRKFQFPKSAQGNEIRQITDMGIKERMQDRKDGGVDVILSVKDESEADNLSILFMKIFPVEGQVIEHESDKGNIQPTPYSSGYKELLKYSNDDYQYFVAYDDNTVSINSFGKHTGMASPVQTFYIDKINDAYIQEPLKSKIISELKKVGKLTLLGKPIIEKPIKQQIVQDKSDNGLESTPEPEKPKGKLVIEPDVMKLIEYLKNEPDAKLRAEMWNNGKDNENNDYILIASRNRIIKGTGNTLWYIISSLNSEITPVVNSGTESKLRFDGNDLIRALQQYARENNMDIEIEQPSDIVKQEKIEQQPEKAPLTKESIEKLIRALEIQNKYKPSEQLIKRINALKIILKYKK